ncbi:MAG TPA: hypothetical protein VLG28_14310 [Acidimicrobiia bacterium]|jgi:hypothetical protein|nr:hypothetical protein [Acidimicrobiia bacterium]
MTDERTGRGIEIPAEVAEAAGLPDDLNAGALDLYPYAVPDPARRRQAAVVYLAAAVVTAALIFAGLPAGMWLIVGVLVALAAWHMAAGWHLEIREWKALEIANRAIGFPVGHASASLGFYGWRSRPIWNILVFSADDPPGERGLVRIDGITGSVVEQYAEPVPEGEL